MKRFDNAQTLALRPAQAVATRPAPFDSFGPVRWFARFASHGLLTRGGSFYRSPRPNPACCRVAVIFCLSAVAALWTAVASADTMSAFGVQYTSLGSATLSSATGGGVSVSNIGSSGSDGVQLTPLSGAAPWAESFSLDTSIDPGTVPTGGYIQETSYGPISAGAPVVSTLTATQGSGDEVMLSGDFPDSPSDQPITIDYYSGGLAGTLVYQETTGGGMFGLSLRKQGGSEPTIQSDWNYYNWPNVSTTGYDSSTAFGDITTVGGTTLPASDDIDFIHFLAPTNLPLDSLDDSSISLTGGGGLGGFAITGEALAVPEPASILLAGSAVAGWAFACLRRRMAKA